MWQSRSTPITRAAPSLQAEVEENFPIALYLARGPAPAVTPLPKDKYKYAVSSIQRRGARPVLGAQHALAPDRAEGLRATVDFRFPLGVPKVKSRETAIEDSRYTLVVLSPAYMEAAMRFRRQPGPAPQRGRKANRLLPVLIKDCEPRSGWRCSGSSI